MAWHLGGISLEQYRSLTRWERKRLHDRLNSMIEEYNTPPPKEL